MKKMGGEYMVANLTSTVTNWVRFSKHVLTPRAVLRKQFWECLQPYLKSYSKFFTVWIQGLCEFFYWKKPVCKKSHDNFLCLQIFKSGPYQMEEEEEIYFSN